MLSAHAALGLRRPVLGTAGAAARGPTPSGGAIPACGCPGPARPGMRTAPGEAPGLAPMPLRGSSRTSSPDAIMKIPHGVRVARNLINLNAPGARRSARSVRAPLFRRVTGMINYACITGLLELDLYARVRTPTDLTSTTPRRAGPSVHACHVESHCGRSRRAQWHVMTAHGSPGIIQLEDRRGMSGLAAT
jgi:hypothetical protein